MKTLTKTMAVAVVLAMSGAAQAVVIFDTGFAATPLGGWFGQKITMPAGSSYGTLVFGIASQGGYGTANGSLWLLDQEYLGTPAGLSAATPGYMAEASSPVGHEWAFSPSVNLAPSTAYWFYNDTSSSWGDGASASSVGGSEYRLSGPNFYVPYGGVYAMDFKLTGEEPIPEPATLSLVAMGALGMLMRRRRK